MNRYSYRFVSVLCLALLVLSISGCRGWRSEKGPVHPNPNMDWQAKFRAQTLSMTPPQGTVAWGRGAVREENESRADYSQSNRYFYEGKNPDGSWVRRVPIDVTESVMQRGRERYGIYCAMCHDRAGTGKGPVIERGFIPPPHLADPRVRAYTDGELFSVISDGIRTMPAYRKQIPEADRWAIVAYVRALQAMQTATVRDVPDSMRRSIQP